MIFTLNGKQESIDGTPSLEALVAAKGLCPERIVVEHNSQIVPKEAWPGTALKDQDKVEIISFVGGG